MAKTKKRELASTEKVLSFQDLLSVETVGRDVNNARLTMAVEEQSLKNMLLNQEILRRDIEKQKLVVEVRAKEYENLKYKSSSINKEIFISYGIESEKFGYDPVTGKIST